MNFTSTDKLLVTALLRSEKVDLFALHSEYLLSPAQLIDSAFKLNEIGVIKPANYEDGTVELAERGIEILLAYRTLIYFREDEWKAIPEHMLRPTIEIDSKYTPNYKKLGNFMRTKQRKIYREMRGRGRVD